MLVVFINLYQMVPYEGGIMRISQLFFIATLLLTCGLAACSDDDGSSGASHTPKVYVVGQRYHDQHTSLKVASIWVDGVRQTLYTNTNNDSWARGIAVDSSTICIAGNDYNGYVSPYPNLALSWENGMMANLPQVTNIAYCQDVAVGNGGVYYVGYSLNQDETNVACYWHNGVRTDLWQGDTHSFANAIFIDENDIYIAGGVWTNGGYTACYWKNGIYEALDRPGNSNTRAYGIYVSGTDVYVCGELQYERGAVLWKNGTATELCATPGGTGTGVALSGTNVYVSGSWVSNFVHKACYWKNGQQMYLPCGPTGNRATDVFIYNSDVYVSGYWTESSTYAACYWKNGIKTYLEPASVPSQAFSIFVY